MAPGEPRPTRLGAGPGDTPGGPPPGPHPPPPRDLSVRSLPLRLWQGPWLRVHRAVRDPLHFGRSGNNRFDDPRAEFGVLYLGADLEGAFVETFGRVVADAPRLVSGRALGDRLLTPIEFDAPLRLVDLSGPGLGRLGADGRLCTGDYRVAQAWSRALWAHPDAPDGLLYRSRHDPSRLCAAVFERAGPRARVRPGESLVAFDLRSHLAAVLDLYGLGLVD
jgi:hypothetical protein